MTLRDLETHFLSEILDPVFLKSCPMEMRRRLDSFEVSGDLPPGEASSVASLMATRYWSALPGRYQLIGAVRTLETTSDNIQNSWVKYSARNGYERVFPGSSMGERGRKPFNAGVGEDYLEYDIFETMCRNSGRTLRSHVGLPQTSKKEVLGFSSHSSLELKEVVAGGSPSHFPDFKKLMKDKQLAWAASSTASSVRVSASEWETLLAANSTGKAFGTSQMRFKVHAEVATYGTSGKLHLVSRRTFKAGEVTYDHALFYIGEDPPVKELIKWGPVFKKDWGVKILNLLGEEHGLLSPHPKYLSSICPRTNIVIRDSLVLLALGADNSSRIVQVGRDLCLTAENSKLTLWIHSLEVQEEIMNDFERSSIEFPRPSSRSEEDTIQLFWHLLTEPHSQGKRATCLQIASDLKAMDSKHPELMALVWAAVIRSIGSLGCRSGATMSSDTQIALLQVNLDEESLEVAKSLALSQNTRSVDESWALPFCEEILSQGSSSLMTGLFCSAAAYIQLLPNQGVRWLDSVFQGPLLGVVGGDSLLSEEMETFGMAPPKVVYRELRQQSVRGSRFDFRRSLLQWETVTLGMGDKFHAPLVDTNKLSSEEAALAEARIDSIPVASDDELTRLLASL